MIFSLWKVDDEATRALMVKFCELWNPKDGSPGLPAAAALCRAQGSVRSQANWSHPCYWAAWVLWGLPEQPDQGTGDPVPMRWHSREHVTG